MIKKIKQLIFTVAAISMLGVPVMAPAVVFAANGNGGGSIQINQNLCAGTSANTSPSSSDCGGADTKVQTVMQNVINFFSLLVGIVSVVMIIIGGFKYIVSNGDSGQISSAKTTIIFALVGLIIVAMAQFIVHFVLGRVVPNISSS